MKKVNPNVGVKTRYQVDLGAMIMEEIHEVDKHKPGGNETLNLFESRHDF